MKNVLNLYRISAEGEGRYCLFLQWDGVWIFSGTTQGSSLKHDDIDSDLYR